VTEQAPPPAPTASGAQPDAQPPSFDEPAPAAKKSRGTLKRIAVYLIGAAVIAGGAIGWKYISGDPDTAKVGDCIAGEVADDMKVVDCGDAKAAHKVVGKVDGKTQQEADQDGQTICGPFPTASSIFWSGEKGGKGYVLCLEDLAG
jgi:hypothetical protein